MRNLSHKEPGCANLHRFTATALRFGLYTWWIIWDELRLEFCHLGSHPSTAKDTSICIVTQISLTQRNVNVHCFLFRVYEDGFFTRPVMCHNIVKAVPLGSVLKPFIFVKEVGFLPKDVQSNTTRAEVLTRPRPPPSLQIAFVILRLSASWWAGAILWWKCELWMRNENGVSQTALLRDDEKTAVIILITKFVYSMNFWTEGVAGFDEAAVPLKAKWVELSSVAWLVRPTVICLPAQWFLPPDTVIVWASKLWGKFSI